ncbi:MucBP domain-containing protein [Furfurilactobacillus entadae]|uniref:MucBP domain-containing protein n=1 Tax=Furfurilactobacillus entadae TaxID=2922307 RepID=UPI0035E84603
MGRQQRGEQDQACHYKLYKSGRFWVAAGISVLAIQGAGIVSAKADSSTTALPVEQPQSVSQSSSQGSAVALTQNQSQVNPTSSSSQSVATQAVMSVASSDGQIQASAASAQTADGQTAATMSNVQTESDQLPSSKAAQANDLNDQSTVHAIQMKTTAVASPVAESISAGSNESAHLDSDVVQIDDPQLKKAMLTEFQVTTWELTYGDVRHVHFASSTKQIDISLIPQATKNPLTSLTGLEVLRELPADWSVRLMVYLKPGVSLVPLTGLHITSALTIQQDGAGNWTDADIAALNSLTLGKLDLYWGIELAGITSNVNSTGLTNNQLLKLDPMFTNASLANPDALYFSLSNQRLSDYSYFSKFSNVHVFSVNNYRVYNTPVNAAQTGNDLTITSQTVGIDGQPALTGYKTYNSSDAPLVTINGHQYIIKNSKQYSTIRYAIIDNQYGVSGYPSLSEVQYANGNTLIQTGMEYYRTTWGNVNVNYVDEQGNVIADAEVVNGDVNATYATTPKTIAGYSVKSVTGDTTGTFTVQPKTVTYVYTKDAVKGADVTVKYVDEQGKEIAPAETLSGNVGDTYTAAQKEIGGYTFKNTEGNSTGTFTDQPQTVTYVYTKNTVQGADVTVKYVDEPGNKIAPSETLSGNVDDVYTATQKSIAGYTFKKVDGNVTGMFTEQVQTITYIYAANEEPSVTPGGNGNGEGTPNSGNNGTDAKGPDGEHSSELQTSGHESTPMVPIVQNEKPGHDTNVKKQMLPETGTTATDRSTVVGVMTVLGTLVTLLGFGRRRKD